MIAMLVDVTVDAGISVGVLEMRCEPVVRMQCPVSRIWRSGREHHS
jgi:hypothetical protein